MIPKQEEDSIGPMVPKTLTLSEVANIPGTAGEDEEGTKE
jgi:hypothetical protein